MSGEYQLIQKIKKNSVPRSSWPN